MYIEGGDLKRGGLEETKTGGRGRRRGGGGRGDGGGAGGAPGVKIFSGFFLLVKGNGGSLYHSCGKENATPDKSITFRKMGLGKGKGGSTGGCLKRGESNHGREQSLATKRDLVYGGETSSSLGQISDLGGGHVQAVGKIF